MKEIDRMKVERDYFATEKSGQDAKLRELIDQWQLEAGSHNDAADDEDSEPGSEEWMLHREAARIFARCADELALAVYRPSPSVSRPNGEAL